MSEENQSIDNPYETPQTRSVVSRNPDNRPLCEKPMERGYLRSSGEVSWFGETKTGMEKFAKGGVKLPHVKKSFSLGRRYNGSFCDDCLLTIIDKP